MSDNVDQRLLNCQLFKGIDPALVVNILENSRKKEYPKGTVLIQKGTVPAALFVVASGDVNIFNEDVLLLSLIHI